MQNQGITLAAYRMSQIYQTFSMERHLKVNCPPRMVDVMMLDSVVQCEMKVVRTDIAV
jgi:hypothetical protein